MKQLHRQDLFGWSEFNEERNIDFHGLLWVRPEGNIIIDPVPLCRHDQEHLNDLGGAAWIVITNSDHLRDASTIALATGAKIAGPRGEAENFPITCDRWLSEGDEVVEGLKVLEMRGSKTPGELALLLEDDTLITGDLIRSHRAGQLCLLPDPKLNNKAEAISSVQRVAGIPGIKAILTGDGWPVFRDGDKALDELAQSLSQDS